MLVANNVIKNLGSIKFGQPQHFTFKLTNTYHTKITIDQLVLGCTACTKADIDLWEIEPEEVATVNVTFTPGSLGLQSKNLTIVHSTGHIQRPPLELKIKANVHD